MAGSLSAALSALFGPVAVAVVGLVTSRHELPVELRTTTPEGIPLLAEATAVIAVSPSWRRRSSAQPTLLCAGGGEPAMLRATVAAVLP